MVPQVSDFMGFCMVDLSMVDGARPRSLPAGGYEPYRRPRYTIKRGTVKRFIFTWTTLDLPPKFGISVFGPFLCM